MSDLALSRNVKPSASNFPPVHDTEVGMGESQIIEVPRYNSDVHMLRTAGRIGCDSVLTWYTSAAGDDSILVTHYPPTQLEEHLRDIRCKAPRGDISGVTRAVYLSYGYETDDWSVSTISEIEQTLGISPDVVRMPDLTPEDAALLQSDRMLYQMVAVRGFGGVPSQKRISIRTPDGNAFLSEF